MAAVTSAQEVELALVDLRGQPSSVPVPEVPELRIAALSPQQREAQAQVVREANRQGFSQDQVEQVAQQAVAPSVSAVAGAATQSSIRDTEPVHVVAPGPPPTSPQTESTPATVAAPSPAAAEANAPISNAEPAFAPALAPVETETLAARPPASDAQARDAPTMPDGSTPTPAPATDTAAPPLTKDAQAAPEDDDTLRPGDRGQQVELLQYRLQRVGYRGPDDAPLPLSGQFDTATEQAVRQFRQDQGLPDIGVVDPDMQQALASAQFARIEPQSRVEPDRPIQVQAATQDSDSASMTKPGARDPSPASREDGLDLSRSTTNMPLAAQLPGEAVTNAPSPRMEHEPTLNGPHGARSNPHPAPPHEPHLAAEASMSSFVPASSRDAALKSIDAESSGAALEPLNKLSQLSPEDRAMFAKIRGSAPSDIPDEVVASAMLDAKRNGIPDADRVGQIGIVDGKLWIGGATPGFHASVSLGQTPVPLQDTLREVQTFNTQQRDQQLAMETPQRGPEDPNQGPRR
ncbi:MAG: peptidoglycan-binding protein [Lysobacter sp.]